MLSSVDDLDAAIDAFALRIRRGTRDTLIPEAQWLIDQVYQRCTVEDRMTPTVERRLVAAHEAAARGQFSKFLAHLLTALGR